MRNKFFFSIALFWSILITILSLVTLNDIGKSIPIPFKDKYVHACFYFGFVFLWMNYFNTKKIHPFSIVVFAIIYGAVIEILQETLTITRQGDFFDVLANSVGAFLGMYVFKTCFKIKKSHS